MVSTLIRRRLLFMFYPYDAHYIIYLTIIWMLGRFLSTGETEKDNKNVNQEPIKKSLGDVFHCRVVPYAHQCLTSNLQSYWVTTIYILHLSVGLRDELQTYSPSLWASKGPRNWLRKFMKEWQEVCTTMVRFSLLNFYI